MHASRKAYYAQRNRSLLLYTAAVLVLGVGVTYASVPLYRLFCSATGFGGTPMTSGTAGIEGSRFSAARLIPFLGDDTRKERKIRVSFNADCSDALPWKFSPLQREVRVRPGESALAFYTATNKSDKDIIGIATYNVTPNNVAPYFAKVECFCFEEQRLLAGEEVDLPILFFIDKDFVDDPSMRYIDDVVLSYTFFRAKRDSYGNLVPDNSTD
ncbi:Cytochrome c oxidase assembly protein cox11, mitochondrial [Cystobasidiomycetes sp. EMM_F5]